MLSRDTKKGLKQVGDVHFNACLHPYFTLMCNSTTYNFQTYSFIGRGIILIVVELNIKVSRDVDVHSSGHHQFASVFFRHPYLTLYFLKELLSYVIIQPLYCLFCMHLCATYVYI